jgi:hypothetical protein
MASSEDRPYQVAWLAKALASAKAWAEKAKGKGYVGSYTQALRRILEELTHRPLS